MNKLLAIIEQGWAKYRDLSVASRSIDLRDTDKSRYFCFGKLREAYVVSFAHEQNIICSQTKLDDIAHEQTIICRQLFDGHVK